MYIRPPIILSFISVQHAAVTRITCGYRLRHAEEECSVINFLDEDPIQENDSPLFTLPNSFKEILGTTSIIEWISAKLDETARERAGMAVLPPKIISAGDDMDLSALGDEAEVPACESLDYLTSSDVQAFLTGDIDDLLAFGYHSSGGFESGLCAALNPCSHTYALAQIGILPDASIANIITLSLDALGFSLEKDLFAETLNEMWDNTGDPESITVPGHVVIKGTGSLGFKVSGNVNVAIEVDTTLLVDADYNGDGIVQPIRDAGEFVSSIDFAVLLSGQASAILEVKSVRKDGEVEWHEIDFSEVLTVDVDIYAVVNNADTAMQLAGSVVLSLDGICAISKYLDALCEFFDPDSSLSASIRAYVNKDGFGVQFAVSGNLGLNSDFIEDLIDWPNNGHSFDAELSLGYSGKTVFLCASANGGKEVCFNRCSKDHQCDDDEFCDLIGSCLKKKGLSHICHKNSVCRSGFCVGGFCSECPTIDSTKGCDAEEQFCTQKIDAVGYRCENKRNLGAACSSKNACKSGYCSGGFCSECPTIDSTQGCDAETEFCSQKVGIIGYRCANKRTLGQACSSKNACKSGFCSGGFCSECPTIDSTRGCDAETEFCTNKLLGNRCAKKRSLGSGCSSHNACKSGHCIAGFCSQCPTIDSSSGCQSNEFCTQELFKVGLRCEAKRGVGGTCTSSNACASRYCVGGFCSECPKVDSSTGCGNNKFCTQKVDTGLRCEAKRGLGGACSSSNACSSGHCVRGFCSECPELDSSTGCRNDQFCAQTVGIGLRCQAKRGVGGTCSSSNACSSGYCVRGFCSECPEIDSSTGCGSNRFCTQKAAVGLRCENKRGHASPCSSGNACSSGICHLGFCSDCRTLARNSNCESGKFCDAGYKCVGKKGRGTPCLNNDVCRSGKCGFWGPFCK